MPFLCQWDLNSFIIQFFLLRLSKKKKNQLNKSSVLLICKWPPKMQAIVFIVKSQSLKISLELKHAFCSFLFAFCGVSLIKRLSRICQSFLLDKEFERQHYTNIWNRTRVSRTSMVVQWTHNNTIGLPIVLGWPKPEGGDPSSFLMLASLNDFPMERMVKIGTLS